MALAKRLAEGILISGCYCMAFLIIWYCSIDQWFLPAGLRIVTLLFRPYREWPFLLAGDAAAMLWLRVPVIESFGYQPLWAYGSPLLHAPIVAAVIFAARRYATEMMRQHQGLVPLVAVATLCNGLCSILLNGSLGGPAIQPWPDLLLRYWTGSYFGTLMFLLPVLLLSQRRQGQMRNDITRDLALALVAVFLLFLTAKFYDDSIVRQLIMAGFIVPVVVLGLRHGWRGTALGALLANVALAHSIPKVHKYGLFDADVFNVQLLQAVAVTALLVWSERIRWPARRASADWAGVSALEASRTAYCAAERLLRSRVVGYSDINVQINRMRKDIVAALRVRGHSAAAMEVTRFGVIESQMLQEYVATLYPLEIETHGVYQMFQSPMLARLCGTTFGLALQGDCKRLSLELQLAAYRSFLNCMELLQGAARYRVKARVWKSGNTQGIALRIMVDSAMQGHLGDPGEAEAELTARLAAHGGLLHRRHASVLSFLIAEPCYALNSMEKSASSSALLPAGHAR